MHDDDCHACVFCNYRYSVRKNKYGMFTIGLRGVRKGLTGICTHIYFLCKNIITCSWKHLPVQIYVYIYINVKILFITNILFYVCPYLAKFLSRSLLQNLRVCRMMSFMFVILDSCPVPEIISLPTDVLEIKCLYQLMSPSSTWNHHHDAGTFVHHNMFVHMPCVL